jgi:hypothetical protein
MFFATAFSRLLNGTVVPRSSATVVPAAAAAAASAGAVAGGGTGLATAVFGTTPLPEGSGAVGAPPTPPACSTSEAVMRPLGPVPTILERSTLSFLASCFAYGVAMTRPSVRGPGPDGVGVEGAGGLEGEADLAGAASGVATASGAAALAETALSCKPTAECWLASVIKAALHAECLA